MPPPIPPAFDIALAIKILNKPKVSLNLNGSNGRCLHVFILQ